MPQLDYRKRAPGNPSRSDAGRHRCAGVSLTEAAKLVRVAIRHTPIEVANRVSIADTMTRPVTWQ